MERACSSSSENGFMRPKGSASKNPAVSALQDLLFYQLTGLGFYGKNVLEFDKKDFETNKKITRLIYLTNKGINFSINAMVEGINEAYSLKNRVENLYKYTCKILGKNPRKPPASALLRPGETLSQMVSQANVINAQKSIRISNYNIFAMHEVIRQSLCASANYLEHINAEENIPENFYSQIFEILNFLSSDNTSMRECRDFALKAGELHTQTMEDLVKTYEKHYGLIERRKVPTGHRKGSAILVVGDDFKFLKELLEATNEKEINIYSYSTLSYAHAFPEVNKYNNFAGLYLGKYDNFSANIENFPGVVVLTTGNIEELTDIFRGRVFATEDISMLGVKKLDKNNLKPLINAAYDAQGYESEEHNCPVELGFGLRELEYFSEEYAKALKSNEIKDLMIFLGCSDFGGDKKYLKKMVKMLPEKSAFITLECIFVQNNFNAKDISEIPKILNLGQFINIFALVRLLFAVAGKLRKDINELPIHITINLRGADTVAALLMLLSLGIKNIKINSELPNYMTESIMNSFQKSYGISKIENAKSEAKNIIRKRA